MFLGNDASTARCAAVWSAVTCGAGLVARPVASTALPGWSAARHGALDVLPLDRALVALAATALLACLAWAWLAVSAVVIDAARSQGDFAGAEGRGGAWRPPLAVRRVVLAACGVALVGVVSPSAVADTHTHRVRHGIAGLPLPDRATAPARRTHPRGATVVVAAGDSLWSIAADHLPPRSSDARINDGWHVLYVANREVVGPDPDHLEPGQRLRMPRKDKDL